MNILAEAEELIYNTRVEQHGDPTDNLNYIARLWSTYLNKGLVAKDVCFMMALLKIARYITGSSKRDNLVDAAGYIGLIERIEDGQTT